MIFLHELHLFHDVCHELRKLQILFMQDLALLVGPREKEQFLNELLHILRLRADRVDPFVQHALIRAAPARKQIRIAENDRHWRAQLMRSV